MSKSTKKKKTRKRAEKTVKFNDETENEEQNHGSSEDDNKLGGESQMTAMDDPFSDEQQISQPIDGAESPMTEPRKKKGKKKKTKEKREKERENGDGSLEDAPNMGSDHSNGEEPEEQQGTMPVNEPSEGADSSAQAEPESEDGDGKGEEVSLAAKKKKKGKKKGKKRRRKSDEGVEMEPVNVADDDQEVSQHSDRDDDGKEEHLEINDDQPSLEEIQQGSEEKGDGHGSDKDSEDDGIPPLREFELEDTSNLTEFKYESHHLKLKVGQIFPVLLPLDIKESDRWFSIIPEELPCDSISFDKDTGCIQGYINSRSNTGIFEYTIECKTGDDSDQIKTRKCEIIIEISNPFQPTSLLAWWVDLSTKKGSIKENRKLTQLTVKRKSRIETVGTIEFSEESARFMQESQKTMDESEPILKVEMVAPFNLNYGEDMPHSLTFDHIHGSLSGIIHHIGKIKFRIIHIASGIKSNTLVLDVIDELTPSSPTINNEESLMLSLDHLQNLKGEEIDLNIHTIFDFFAEDDGLDENGMLHSLQLLKYNITRLSNKRMFQEYTSKGGESSGFISKEQLESMIESEGLTRISSNDFHRAFSVFKDEPKDTHINYDEFTEGVTSIGDSLDESCLETIRKIADPNQTNKLELRLLEKSVL